MTVEWVGIGPELLIGLERAGTEPLGQQVQAQLRDAIRAGRLEAGERLPSSRALAEQLGVSRGLIVDCYAQLESEGYLSSKVGAGTVVADGVADPGSDATARSGDPSAPATPRPQISFEYGMPDLNLFPMKDWQWALGVACRTANVGHIGDEHGGGSPELCEVLAGYVRRVRGASARADDVVICAGYRNGLNVVLRTLAHAGFDSVAVEDPGPVGQADIAQRAGLDVVHVPVDEHGLDVEQLDATAARVVVLTPAHQCPTGALLAPDRRQALIAWARRVGGFVVEDDYDAEFRYDRQPVGAMQGLAPDCVVAMGSVSKTLAPTLRIGWIVCPPPLRNAIEHEKQLLGRGVPGIDQLALAALIESGRFDKHLRHMRGVYRSRREALVSCLADVAPGVRVGGLAAGCHAVLHLGDGVDEATVVAAAGERSIGVTGLGQYRSDHRTEPAGLVLGFGNVTEPQIVRGLTTIADLLG